MQNQVQNSLPFGVICSELSEVLGVEANETNEETEFMLMEAVKERL